MLSQDDGTPTRHHAQKANCIKLGEGALKVTAEAAQPATGPSRRRHRTSPYTIKVVAGNDANGYWGRDYPGQGIRKVMYVRNRASGVHGGAIKKIQLGQVKIPRAGDQIPWPTPESLNDLKSTDFKLVEGPWKRYILVSANLLQFDNLSTSHMYFFHSLIAIPSSRHVATRLDALRISMRVQSRLRSSGTESF